MNIIDFPTQLINYIFTFLPVIDVLNTSILCKKLQHVCMTLFMPTIRDLKQEYIFCKKYNIFFKLNMRNFQFNSYRTSIIFCGIYISKLPILRDFINLKILKLKCCKLEYFPNIEYMPAIRILSLKHNNIKYFDGNIHSLSLEVLNLSYNNIEDLNEISGAVNLKILKLNNNFIRFIPKFINLCNLEYLNLMNNFIVNIPNFKLYNLKTLKLSYCNMNNIGRFKHLNKLEKLVINDSCLESIDICLNLTKLEYLNLSKNSIEKLDNINLLTNLRFLLLNHNKINQVNNLHLPNLEYMDIRDNNITTTININNFAHNIVIDY